MYSVYIHKNKSNNKQYVGITSCDPKVRWKKGYGYSDQLPIGRAMRKYGWDGFTHEIIASDLSEIEAKSLEVKLISDLQTQNPDFGYNICAGGEGVTGWHPSSETRQKISEAAKQRCGEKNPNYGHKWTDEMKEIASKRRKGNYSDKTRKKISEAAKKRCGDKNPFYGKSHSEETKELISKLRRKPVAMFSKDNTLLQTYNSIKEASEDTGINKVAISNCCRGVKKTSGGFIWRYA